MRAGDLELDLLPFLDIPSFDKSEVLVVLEQDVDFGVGEVLRTSGDAEVSDGFQRDVQEKVKRGLFATDSDRTIRIIVWPYSVE